MAVQRGVGDSRRQRAASVESSSMGLRLCLTPAIMIALLVWFMRGLIYVVIRGWVNFYSYYFAVGRGLIEDMDGEKKRIELEFRRS